MKLKLLIVLTFAIFLSQYAFAEHENGAEIRYRQLDSLKFEITMIKYSDCSGVGAVATDITIYNDSFYIITKPTKISAIVEKSPYCKAKCGGTNTSFGIYYVAHLFRDTVDFNNGNFKLFGTKNYPEVFFSNSGNYRSTYQFANGAFFVESMLNLFYIKAQNEKIEFNDFYNPPEFHFYCGSSINYSFRLRPNAYNDVYNYSFVKAMSDRKTFYNHDPNKPFYYYCDNVSTLNCKSNTKVHPVRGISLNPSNGNFFATPINCAEDGTMVCQVSTSRKLGDSLIVVGYIKRDFQFLITQDKNVNIPYVPKNMDYTIKAREKFCVDIPVIDDTTQMQGPADSLEIEIINYPKYGKLTIIDSQANYKILRYCWNPSDSDYLNKNSSEIFFRVREKNCTPFKSYSISNTTKFIILAPDSFTNVTVKTYEDKNRNGKKDMNESYKPAPFFMQQNAAYNILQSDSNGNYNLKLLYSKFQFGIPAKLEYIPSSKDTFINSKFDSTYVVELGFNYRQGIKGRVYVDYNKNCISDKIEIPIAGFEIQVKGENRKVYTDANGYYFIHAKAGTYTIEPLPKKEYKTTCYSSYSVSITADSIKNGYDFAVQKNTAFKDLSILLKPEAYILNNWIMNNEIVVQNLGLKTEKNVQVKLITSVPLTGLFYNKTIYKIADTLVWIIDSVSKGNSSKINFSHIIDKDSFSNGDKLCYKLFLDNDSVMYNNYYSSCETIYDTVPKLQFKTSKNPDFISETHPELNYELAFQDSFNTRTRILILDSLDASIFDINSFRITHNPNNYSVNLLDHVIFAELSGNISPYKAYTFSYSIRLKDAINKEFDIVNKAYRTADNTQKFMMAEVSNRTRSFIGLNILDTIVCRGKSIQIAVNTQDKLQNGNRFKVYLSDSTGDFTSKTLILDTAVKTRNSMLTCKLPLSVAAGKSYKISISSSRPETNSFTSESNQTIEILPLPIPVLSSNLKDGKLCAKDTLKLSASGGILYQFYYSNFPATIFSSKSTLNFMPQNKSSVAVTVQDANGCINKTENSNINIVPLPNITLTATPNVICAGKTVVLKSSGSINTKSYFDTSFWKNINSDEDIISNPLFKTSTFKVIGNDSFGCKNEAKALVTVNPLPAKPGIYQNQKALYSAFNTGNQWYSETGKIDSAKNKYFYPPINGIYRLEYTDNNGCTAISDPYPFIYYSIHFNSFDNGILFYPNPSNGIVRYEYHFQSTLTIEIYSADGKKVYTSAIDNSSGTIDLQHLPSGTYTVKTKSSGVENRQILVIVR